MNPGDGNYVSVISTALLQPIVTLLESLENLNPQKANDVQVSDLENGYAASICVLTVLLLESTINRARYVRKINGLNSIECFASLILDIELNEQLKELYVLRDVIAHNHIWLARINQDTMTFIDAVRLPGYGDRKFLEVFDKSTRKTRKLGLNIFPTRIGLSDARTVLATASHILVTFENLDRSIIYISNKQVTYRGSRLTLQDLVNNWNV